MKQSGMPAIALLHMEVTRLRAGEEGGWEEGTIPTPGQYLRKLHEFGEEERLRSLDVLLEAAEAGRQCGMSLHAQNLSELRQRTMSTWSVLTRIAELCRDPERDGLVHVSEIVELLPDGLRHG